MSISRNWIVKFATRVLSNTIGGGFITAIVGAFCVATAGAIVGVVLDVSSSPNMGLWGFGAFLGMFMGAWSGIIGAIIFGVAASSAKPGRFFAPLILMKRVALGQILGTSGALSSYLLFALAVAQLKAQPFIGTVEDHLELAIYGVPVSMVCGAIAGALWKRADGATQ